MRRKDREIIGREPILALLERCQVLRLGLCDADRPYVVPMLFAAKADREPLYIYMHSAAEGRKMDIISKNNRVCFEADHAYRTVNGQTPCEWSGVYQSVMGEGTIHIVTDEAEKTEALNALMGRYGFEGTPRYDPDAFRTVTVLRVTVDSLTGKSTG